ncbi:MAG: hypothetical protein ACM3VT_02370 [Solirubrobacterales bacterium]
MTKRWIVVIGVALLVVIGSYSVFAQPRQGQQGQPPMGGGMGRGGMMCPMCGAMGGAMLQKSIVAVEGGVIVAMGDKLVKYDADLNKVKEVALDIDFTSMQQKMQAMMQNCPMHQQMMRSQQSQSDEATAQNQ